MRIVFFRLGEESDKAGSLRYACERGEAPSRYVRSVEELREVPGAPFAYWLSSGVRALFRNLAPFAEVDGVVVRHAKQGLATSDDGRFIRDWYEVPVARGRWRSIAKGRTSAPFYTDIPEVITWENRGSGEPARELKAYIESKPGNTHWSRRIASVSYYLRPGFTWPVRAARFVPRALPADSVFSHRGYSSFTDAQGDELMSLIGLCSSSVVDFLFKVHLGRFGYPEFLVGVLPRLPVYTNRPVAHAGLALLAHKGWSLSRELDTTVEDSHAYVLPAVLHVEGSTLAERQQAWLDRATAARASLAAVQSEIDELCFDLYGISGEDRLAITEGFGVTDSSEDDGSDDGADVDDAEGVRADPEVLAAGLVSWAVGVVAGRFDVRLATGDRDWPQEPGPFDPLPACSPAMLTGDDGLPLGDPPVGYPVPVSPVLVDDPGHALDVTAGVRAVFDLVFGADADEWWVEVGEALGVRRREIAAWLRKGFFDHHLKSHSKSLRKAPILWPIGNASGSYVVWLYAHRVTADSLFQVLSDIVEPKLGVEQRRLTELTQEAGPNPSASQRKAIDTQETLVGELRELRDGLEAVTPLWAPDLNDGIVIVLAPLWRLFAHHKAWSRELKKHWDKLATGDYDWAQLAMHLWPERVIPKCAEDRSLAIAHGLEDVFWVQDADNTDKWHPRTAPSTPVDQLIAERHNPATRAALEATT